MLECVLGHDRDAVVAVEETVIRRNKGFDPREQLAIQDHKTTSPLVVLREASWRSRYSRKREKAREARAGKAEAQGEGAEYIKQAPG